MPVKPTPRGIVRLSGGCGAIARITHIDVDAQQLHSWADVDELLRQIRRSANKVFGEHPNTNYNPHRTEDGRQFAPKPSGAPHD